MSYVRQFFLFFFPLHFICFCSRTTRVYIRPTIIIIIIILLYIDGGKPFGVMSPLTIAPHSFPVVRCRRCSGEGVGGARGRDSHKQQPAVTSFTYNFRKSGHRVTVVKRFIRDPADVLLLSLFALSVERATNRLSRHTHPPTPIYIYIVADDGILQRYFSNTSVTRVLRDIFSKRSSTPSPPPPPTHAATTALSFSRSSTR